MKKIALKNFNKPAFIKNIEVYIRRMKGEGKRAVIFEFAQFLLLVVILGAALFSLFANANSLLSSTYEKRRLIGEIDKAVDSEAQLKKDVQFAKEAVSAMQNLFPGEDDLPKFLSSVDGLADAVGATAALEIGETSAVGSDERGIAFRIDTGLKLREFIQYIGELEKLPYLAVVNSFEISAPEGVANTPGRVKINGTLMLK